jgi:ribosomal protein S18 acetylase RimI-like enzyme
MHHVLDNAAWYALNSGNATLALGTDEVKFFDPGTSPFVGLAQPGAESFAVLHQTAPDNAVYLFVIPEHFPIPENWKVVHHTPGNQMVYNGGPIVYTPKFDLVTLTDEHIPQMLGLTKLTNPGPFVERTIDFGHYKGIFEGDKLVAMAGQRLNPTPYAEVSAVCTHPDHTGKGYARELLIYHINRIIAAEEIPFLHVRYDNYRAIKLYEDIGFETRTIVHFQVIKKIF